MPERRNRGRGRDNFGRRRRVIRVNVRCGTTARIRVGNTTVIIRCRRSGM